jgi:hypothetical protein
MAEPYNVYGGLQDNGTWMGPSRAIDAIANRHWRNLYFGDGFWAFPDPADNDYAYVEYQGGMIARFRKIHRRGQGHQAAARARTSRSFVSTGTPRFK